MTKVTKKRASGFPDPAYRKRAERERTTSAKAAPVSAMMKTSTYKSLKPGDGLVPLSLPPLPARFFDDDMVVGPFYDTRREVRKWKVAFWIMAVGFVAVVITAFIL